MHDAMLRFGAVDIMYSLIGIFICMNGGVMMIHYQRPFDYDSGAFKLRY